MSPLASTLKHVRRVLVAVLGVSIISLGVAMIVLPGPACVVIPIGLGVLSTEFVWARNLLHRIKDRLPARFKKGWGSYFFKEAQEKRQEGLAGRVEDSQEKYRC